MTRIVRARFEGGVLKPLDPIDLKEGDVVDVVVLERSFRGFREALGGYRFRVSRDVVEEFLSERR